jgi:hypothetical protein
MLAVSVLLEVFWLDASASTSTPKTVCRYWKFAPSWPPPINPVSVRLAEQDDLIYLDLADQFWRCIEIGAKGWRIAEDPPVRFRRGPSMQPLPLPVRGGSIEALAPFLNLASENDFVLVVACC